MEASWRGPPPYEVLSKSKPINDFIAWHVAAPVVSERAADVLRNIGGSCMELLPFGRLREKQYFALNVMCQADCVDWDRSDVIRLPNVDEALAKRIVLREGAETSLNIFKLKGIASRVYISEAAAGALYLTDLTGFSLARLETDISACVRQGAVPDEYRPPKRVSKG